MSSDASNSVFIDSLECRQHLSATLTNGVLSVKGTTASEVIVVVPTADKIVVQIKSVKQTFAKTAVTSVVIAGGDGNDKILCDLGRAVKIDGGNGDDLVTGTELNDTITGGAGNDVIQGQGGNDSILGGDGNDLLRGQLGADTVRGGNGN